MCVLQPTRNRLSIINQRKIGWAQVKEGAELQGGKVITLVEVQIT